MYMYMYVYIYIYTYSLLINFDKGHPDLISLQWASKTTTIGIAVKRHNRNRHNQHGQQTEAEFADRRSKLNPSQSKPDPS